MKCKIKMGDKVLPVPGSVKGETGTCPECETPGVMLSVVGGFIRAHVVSPVETPENNPQPATLVEPPVKYGKGLTEPVVDLTDTGVRIGDPRAAELRRTAMIEGAAGIGVVQVPRKVPGKGVLKSGAPRMTTRMFDAPATEENVRAALDYWRNRRVTKRTPSAVRQKQADMMSSLSRRLEAIMRAQEVRYNTASRTLDVVAMTPVKEQAHLGARVDAAQGHRGPTLVRGRDIAPRERERDVPWDQHTDMRQVRKGPRGSQTIVSVEPRKATTNEAPMGRERFDRKITDVPEPPRRRTAAERNRYRKAQRALRKAKA